MIGAAIGPGLGGFWSGGVNVGVNSSGQVFVSVQGSVTTGLGAFAGAGVQYGIGYNSPRTCPGDSGWTPSVEGDANVGFGLAQGGSVNFGQGSITGQAGGCTGVGYGAQGSVGRECPGSGHGSYRSRQSRSLAPVRQQSRPEYEQ